LSMQYGCHGQSPSDWRQKTLWQRGYLKKTNVPAAGHGEDQNTKCRGLPEISKTVEFIGC
jgi:hypothetical protein